jgi:putative tryptophan/tyrosine transport system substrate-binding protein
VILASSTTNLTVVQQATSTVPVVFIQVSDPVAQGFVANVTRPGGNLTGFSMYEFAIGNKWLDLLKEIAPKLARVGVMFNPDTSPQSKFFMRSIEAAAPSLGVEVITLSVRATGDIEPAIENFARAPNGGLILPTDSFIRLRQTLIAELASRHRLLAVSADADFARNGGLMYYGATINLLDQFRQAANYVDRILKGAKPGDLPIQRADKYTLVINLKVAKALGLTVPLPLAGRNFITLLGGLAAWPLAARAQQAVPVIGFLHPGPPDDLSAQQLNEAFGQGLGETGYVEGSSVAIVHRWANNRYERLAALAAELVQRQVVVIVAGGSTAAALAAKAATKRIPIVFTIGSDPVDIGLVDSISRPGGNVTGVSNLFFALTAKRLELLHDLVPTASVIALLVNPTNAYTEPEAKAAQAAARTLGLHLDVVHAISEIDIDGAFATLVRQRTGALLVGADPVFTVMRDQLVALAARHKVPGPATDIANLLLSAA